MEMKVAISNKLLTTSCEDFLGVYCGSLAPWHLSVFMHEFANTFSVAFREKETQKILNLPSNN